MQDRATWHDLSQGPIQQTGNPLDVAIDGNGFLVVQTPRGERYTRNGALQINATGELVTIDGYQVLGDAGPIQFQTDDHDIVINPDGTITVREGDSHHRFAARQTPARELRTIRSGCRRTASSLFSAPAGVAPQAPRRERAHRAGLDREIQRPRRDRDDAHDRGHAHLHRSRHHAAAAGDMRADVIQQLADVPA